MIVMFTDYGVSGPYPGQVQAVLHRDAPGVAIVNLFADVPRQNIKAGAYLLRAYTADFPDRTVFLCVVDPGVGTFADLPVALKIDGCWYIGPDNGLFEMVASNGRDIECLEITWRPEQLSSSFHGRDLYAPVAAMLATGRVPPATRCGWQSRYDWPEDLPEVIYIDHFGNVISGVRAAGFAREGVIRCGQHVITSANTFGAVPAGQLFWYGNANGLVEIAVNRGSAAQTLNIRVGNSLVMDPRPDPGQ